MNIRMSRPWLHPTTGQFYYRSRLRADVAVMAGRTVTIDVGGESCTIKLGDLVKVSLRTRDVSEARLRHASVQAQLEQPCACA